MTEDLNNKFAIYVDCQIDPGPLEDRFHCVLPPLPEGAIIDWSIYQCTFDPSDMLAHERAKAVAKEIHLLFNKRKKQRRARTGRRS